MTDDELQSRALVWWSDPDAPWRATAREVRPDGGPWEVEVLAAQCVVERFVTRELSEVG